MTCGPFEDLVDARVDGTLAASDRPKLEAHLAECPRCREDLASLQQIRAAAATLPRARTPGRDLWPGVAERLLADGSPAPRMATGQPRRTRWAWAAAVGLIVVSSGATAMLMRRGASPGAGEADQRPGLAVMPVRDGPPLPLALQETEDEFRRAAVDLAGVLESRGGLDSEVRTRLEHLVAVVDQAIAESRAVVARHPEDAAALTLLWSAHRRKIELLDQAARLGQGGGA